MAPRNHGRGQRGNSLRWEPMGQPSKQRGGQKPPWRAVGQREETLVTFCGLNILNELTDLSQGVWALPWPISSVMGLSSIFTQSERLHVWPPLLQLGVLSEQAEGTSQHARAQQCNLSMLEHSSARSVCLSQAVGLVFFSGFSSGSSSAFQIKNN